MDRYMLRTYVSTHARPLTVSPTIIHPHSNTLYDEEGSSVSLWKHDYRWDRLRGSYHRSLAHFCPFVSPTIYHPFFSFFSFSFPILFDNPLFTPLSLPFRSRFNEMENRSGCIPHSPDISKYVDLNSTKS